MGADFVALIPSEEAHMGYGYVHKIRAKLVKMVDQEVGERFADTFPSNGYEAYNYVLRELEQMVDIFIHPVETAEKILFQHLHRLFLRMRVAPLVFRVDQRIAGDVFRPARAVAADRVAEKGKGAVDILP